jgi:hypothetical protein
MAVTAREKPSPYRYRQPHPFLERSLVKIAQDKLLAVIAGGRLSGRQQRQAIAFLVLAFLCITALRWCSQPPIGSDSDEHLLVARTFLRTGHFSVGDVHATKYPPLLSSLAILFQLLPLNVPLSLVIFNCLTVLASSLALFALIQRNNRIGLLSVLPVLYLMSNTVLWGAAAEIIAHALFAFLVTVALLLAVTVEEWTLRRTLGAMLVAFASAMSRTAGLVVILPLAAAIISEQRRRGEPFPYGKLALLAFPPIAALVLFMVYEARFGPHTTGYLETFFLKDPFDASKGALTFLGFLTRLAGGPVGRLRDIRDLTVFPSCAGLFSFLLPFALFIFALLGRDRKTVVVLCSFVVPYLLVASVWPYQGTRFVLPLLPVAALGIEGALSASLHSRNRIVGAVFALLLISHLGVNLASLRKEARDQCLAREFLNTRFAQLTEWCSANIPEGDAIASFDYREVMLKLDRPVLPLGYSSDANVHIAQLERGNVKWLVLCWHVFPPRGTYAKGVVDALGPRASLRWKNDSCEVYRLDLPPW